MKQKTILFIHQSAELYGSDKTLLYLVESIFKFDSFNVIVVLPENGSLKDLLEEKGITVIISPIVKLSRQMYTLKGTLCLPFNLISSLYRLRRFLKEVHIDIIHSNTMAVLVGAFYSKIYGIKHIWHIHEIIERPKFVKNNFPKFVNFFSDRVVFNSEATSRAFTESSNGLIKKSQIILNGLDRNQNNTASDIKKAIRKELFGADESNIVIGLIGRINKWKGQELLLESFSRISEKGIKLVFVGSAPPGQEYFVRELKDKIIFYNVEDNCRIIPFQRNIWPIFDSIDISVIPSVDPEPFGLVALESMLAEKVVIASNHGGVTEIVKHNETGFLFEPNNKSELIMFLKQLINDEHKRFKFGREGRLRALKKFSLDTYVSKFINLYRNI